MDPPADPSLPENLGGDGSGAGPLSRWFALIAAVVAFIPRALTTGTSITIDEALWLDRSVAFGDALSRFDFAEASATTDGLATMPGVTTMWIGSIARLVHGIGRGVGLIEADTDFATSTSGLQLSQLGVAIVTSLLIGFIVWLSWSWMGGIAATVTGALLATEPFLVAHGAVLHTDELTALFGAGTVIAFARLYGYGGAPLTHPRRWAVLAGVGAAFTGLTKLSAGLYLPSLGLLLLIAIIRDLAHRHRADADLGTPWYRTPSLVHTAIAAAVAVATVAVLWPAIWADRANQIELIRQSAALAETPHLTFFMGEQTENPNALFYLIATPFRLTPWFLLANLSLIPAALVDRRLRSQAFVLSLVTIVGLVVLTVSAKKFDRYVIPLLPMLAMLVGLGASRLWDSFRSYLETRPVRVIAGTLLAGMFVHAVAITPWSLLYYNPMFGGTSTVERTVIVGWGEGITHGLDLIRHAEGGDCSAVTIVASYKTITDRHPCGTRPANGEKPTHILRYINSRQRGEAAPAGRLIGTIEQRDFVLLEIYDLR